MAGEYSRELSVKVFAGQCRLIEHGFRQGGPAGFGLRRLLIDEGRNPKGELGRGDRKSLQTDRVVLTPGPPEEIEHVHNIYSMFVEEGKSEREIALVLNQRGIMSDLGRPWTRASIHQILTNEKYIGNNIFNRVSYKLKQRRVVNQRATWVRADGVFPSIVDRALFDRARLIIDQRGNHYSDEELLALLQAVLDEEGSLSGLIIDERDGMPSSSLYRHRFGSLLRAYSLIGYAPDRDYRYREFSRHVFEIAALLRVLLFQYNYRVWVVETIWTKLAAPHAVIETSLQNSSQERNFLLQRPGGETGSFGSIAGAETAVTRVFGRHVFEIAALLRVPQRLHN